MASFPDSNNGKNNLMDDSRAWFPKAHSVFCCSARQEVVDLVVDFLESDDDDDDDYTY